jgi:hypothetical protein
MEPSVDNNVVQVDNIVVVDNTVVVDSVVVKFCFCVALLNFFSFLGTSSLSLH